MPNKHRTSYRDPWPIRLLYFFCKPYYADEIAGDLLEIHARVDNSDAKSVGKLLLQVLGFIRLRYLKSVGEILNKNGLNMYGNYFKISFRNLAKHRLFSALNISGLAVGLAGALLITIHLINEWSYDKHIPEAASIYYLSNGLTGRYSPAPLPQAMLAEIPEVKEAIRCWTYSDLNALIGENRFALPNGLATDSTFFDIFPNEFVQGTAETALSAPNSVVLTVSTAERLFGDEDPVGKAVEIEGEKGIVTAVVKDVKKQTSVPYEYLVALPHEPFVVNGNWTGNNFFTYVKTIPDADPFQIELKIAELVRAYAAPELQKYGYNIDEYMENRSRPFQMIGLTDIHLKYPFVSFGVGGSMMQFWILSVIGLMLLLIAIINYINLITAKSGLRLKEIGLRKVFGSQRSFIIRQFFVESAVITLIAFALALVLTLVSLPMFGDLVQRELTYQELFNSKSMVGYAILLVLTAFLSGLYPAMFLSGFTPVLALKGEFVGTKMSMRKALVIFQFSVSIVLITTTVIVYKQVQLMRQFETGWNKEATFAIRDMDAVSEQLKVVKEELRKLPFVEEVSLTNMMPSQQYISNYNYQTTGEEERTLSPDHIFADEKYLDVLDLELIKGRFFERGYPGDSMTIVINETLANELQWEEVVGRKLSRGPGDDFTIIGVIKDFYPTSVKRMINPLVIRFADEVNERVSISDRLLIKMSNIAAFNVTSISKVYERYSQGYPFDGVFLSDTFQRLYKNEERFGKVFSTFAGLALFIASLGLISLAAYSMERRTKEIAVRKVLGANGPQLVRLLLSEYMLLILMASVISVPVVYYYMMDWLGDFANRIQLNWIVFIFPVLAVAVFTLLLVLGQTLKMTQSNPVHSLKQE